MPMNCPSCGRALASGAKCIYCAEGKTPRRREELAVPKGATKAPGRTFAVPWKTVLVLLILGGAAAAIYHHPEWQAQIREWIKF